MGEVIKFGLEELLTMYEGALEGVDVGLGFDPGGEEVGRLIMRIDPTWRPENYDRLDYYDIGWERLQDIKAGAILSEEEQGFWADCVQGLQMDAPILWVRRLDAGCEKEVWYGSWSCGMSMGSGTGLAVGPYFGLEAMAKRCAEEAATWHGWAFMRDSDSPPALGLERRVRELVASNEMPL